MGDIEEDLKELLETIDAHVAACELSVSEGWRVSEGLSDRGDLEDACADVKTTREEMLKSLRAFIDPRTCA